jgi:hypothetical protein
MLKQQIIIGKLKTVRKSRFIPGAIRYSPDLVRTQRNEEPRIEIKERHKVMSPAKTVSTTGTGMRTLGMIKIGMSMKDPT